MRHENSGLRERHLFYVRHRAVVILIAFPATALLLWLVLTRMNPMARRADGLLFTIALLHFGLVHLWGSRIERWFPKELIVALVFSIATAIPTWSRLTQGKGRLTVVAVLFFTLCWLNCIAIEKWEGTAAFVPPSERTRRWGQDHLQHLCLFLATAAMLASSFFLHASFFWATGLCISIALSVALLAALDYSGLSAFHLRIAADAALLTPLLLLLVH